MILLVFLFIFISFIHSPFLGKYFLARLTIHHHRQNLQGLETFFYSSLMFLATLLPVVQRLFFHVAGNYRLTLECGYYLFVANGLYIFLYTTLSFLQLKIYSILSYILIRSALYPFTILKYFISTAWILFLSLIHI